MRSHLILLFAFCFFVNCSSQEKIKNKPSETKAVDQKFFIGKWKLQKTIIKYPGKEILQKNSNCAARSYWEFVEKRDLILQSFKTYNGKDCSTFTVTRSGKLTVSGDRINYFSDDIWVSSEYRIINKKQFAVFSKDLINSEAVIIEKQYSKIE